jgi:uncharacterized protein
MKYLLVLAIVGIAFYWWRHNRRAETEHAEKQARAKATPQASHRGSALMLRCRHCGVHLPETDAVRGQLGPYCGTEHRRLAEG